MPFSVTSSPELGVVPVIFTTRSAVVSSLLVVLSVVPKSAPTEVAAPAC